jgi:RHS repeat-associated protein
MLKNNSGNILLETDGSQNIKIKYIRDNSGEAKAFEEDGNIYYYLYNAHGDVTSVTDSSGNTVATYNYDEFGNEAPGTSNQAQIYNPLRYSGANNAYYDSETGLYKMGARYYMPQVGRWLTRDTDKGDQQGPQSLNKYVYCENNPVNNSDPSGLHKTFVSHRHTWYGWCGTKWYFYKTRHEFNGVQHLIAKYRRMYFGVRWWGNVGGIAYNVFNDSINFKAASARIEDWRFLRRIKGYYVWKITRKDLYIDYSKWIARR